LLLLAISDFKNISHTSINTISHAIIQVSLLFTCHPSRGQKADVRQRHEPREKASKQWRSGQNQPDLVCEKQEKVKHDSTNLLVEVIEGLFEGLDKLVKVHLLHLATSVVHVPCIVRLRMGRSIREVEKGWGGADCVGGGFHYEREMNIGGKVSERHSITSLKMLQTCLTSFDNVISRAIPRAENPASYQVP
jgi:hypothetical protein